eukprot:9736346-Karenia_brevis.AAC.1
MTETQMQTCKALDNLKKEKDAAQQVFTQMIQDLRQEIVSVEQKMEETMKNYQTDIDQLQEQEKIMEDQRTQLATSNTQPLHQPAPPSQHQSSINITPSDIHNLFSTCLLYTSPSPRDTERS